MKPITKKEFLALRTKHKVYYPPAMILDIYEDDDILPEYVVECMCQPHEPISAIIMSGSAEFIAHMDELVQKECEKTNN